MARAQQPHYLSCYGQNPAPAKKPWNDDSLSSISMVSKWCRISTIHRMSFSGFQTILTVAHVGPLLADPLLQVSLAIGNVGYKPP